MYQIKKPDSIKKRKRVGCGPGSGHGKTSCRGQKGQRSRSGYSQQAGFEGGQMPLQRRVPKRGFNNYTRKEFQVVNLSSIDKLGLDSVTPALLVEKRIVNHSDRLIKVLGNGEIKKSVTIVADAFSKSAIEKIKKAGGNPVIRKSPSVVEE
ncbi:MAG TPA: 50S ribosomal protein L15 [Spirochaetota bacterium]|nr:50S ribosomal protein L15 [Spirochaetota bacterium]